MDAPTAADAEKTGDSCPPWSRWLHTAVSRIQAALLPPGDLPPGQIKRRIAEALAALEDPPTHADALIAHQLRARVRAGWPGPSPHRRWAGGHRKVALALDVIRRRHRDPALRLADAAQAAGLSPAYLGRLLVQVTGLGFAEHLRRARVSAAEVMLTTTTLSIKEVAHAVGYGSSGAFDRAFRQVHALAPLEWMRQHSTGATSGIWHESAD